MCCCLFLVAKLCPAVWNPWTVARQAPLSMEFSRQEYWSGVPLPPPGDLPDPGIEAASLTSPALASRFFTTSATWEAHRMAPAAESHQSCLTLCDRIDGSPPGSSVPGILQARILERVAMRSLRGSSRPRGGTLISYVSCIGKQVLYHMHHLGNA